jgi:hypothetical protein
MLELNGGLDRRPRNLCTGFLSDLQCQYGIWVSSHTMDIPDDGDYPVYHWFGSDQFTYRHVGIVVH